MKLFGLLIILFLFFVGVPLRTLTPLPVPLVSQTYTPFPLAMDTTSVSVLGTEVIDPVDFVNEINTVRKLHNAQPLRLSTTLTQAAQLRAHVILKYQNFSHQDPYEGIELATILPKLRYHYLYASENIGMGGLSAKDFVNGFMHSQAHKDNLLDPRLSETGAAFATGQYKQYYVNIAVQLFAIPAGINEYLGYTTSDKLVFEESLHTLTISTHPVRLFTQQLLQNPVYAKTNIEKWQRQRDILQTIVVKMRSNQPFASSDVALILEYNKLL